MSKHIYYFGCWSKDKIGHYLYDANGWQMWDGCPRLPDDFPVRSGILDGGLLPPHETEVQGRAVLCYVGGWTIISFWDRSADKRPACNSAFVITGTLDFEAAVTVSRKYFPSIWERFDFEVTCAKAPQLPPRGLIKEPAAP